MKSKKIFLLLLSVGCIFYVVLCLFIIKSQNIKTSGLSSSSQIDNTFLVSQLYFSISLLCQRNIIVDFSIVAEQTSFSNKRLTNYLEEYLFNEREYAKRFRIHQSGIDDQNRKQIDSTLECIFVFYITFFQKMHR